MMKMMNKFLQEFNRDITEPERIKLLKKHYKALEFNLTIYASGSETIMRSRFSGKNKSFVMEDVIEFLTCIITYKTSDWKKLLRDYEKTINGHRICRYVDYEHWASESTNLDSKRPIFKNVTCLAFISGVDLVFTNFKGIRPLKVDDYLITRLDLVRWERPLCMTTKEQDYI